MQRSSSGPGADRMTDAELLYAKSPPALRNISSQASRHLVYRHEGDAGQTVGFPLQAECVSLSSPNLTLKINNRRDILQSLK